MYRDGNRRGVQSGFDEAGKDWPFRPGRTAPPMTQIKTRQIRRRRSHQFGEMFIEHTYVDRPASLETWIDHCAALGAEFGISALDVHTALFAQLPEIFGR
jgi:hypothetical protein